MYSNDTPNVIGCTCTRYCMWMYSISQTTHWTAQCTLSLVYTEHSVYSLYDIESTLSTYGQCTLWYREYTEHRWMHATSLYITLHHSTSLYITLHHSTSLYITLHHSSSLYITLHHMYSVSQSTSTCNRVYLYSLLQHTKYSNDTPHAMWVM